MNDEDETIILTPEDKEKILDDDTITDFEDESE